MSDPQTCLKCGRILHTGEGRILISFTIQEATELAYSTSNPEIRSRIACAVGLLDSTVEAEIRA